ncbi:MAG TPA: hypothetical protein PKW97_05400 [Syntrophorhabdus sp.]|jgi:hypothetical protein|nr:hypothetical protein [Syntrophorhabdus sp.]
MIGRSVVVNVKMDFVQSSGGGETTLLKRIVIWVLRAQHVICCASFARGGDYEYQ